jgi:multidrug resistance efflux pump
MTVAGTTSAPSLAIMAKEQSRPQRLTAGRAEVASARARLAEAAAELDDARGTGDRPSVDEAAIARAKAECVGREQVRAEAITREARHTLVLASAQAQHDRVKNLFDKGAATQLEMDQANKDLETARMYYQESKSNLAAAEAGIDECRQGLQMAMARLPSNLIQAQRRYATAAAGLEASVANLRVIENEPRATISVEQPALPAPPPAPQVTPAPGAVEVVATTGAAGTITYWEVRAPVAGIVDRETSTQGEAVRLGAPVVWLLDPSQVGVSCFLSAAMISRVREGQRVVVVLEGRKDLVPGAIARIGDQLMPPPQSLRLTQGPGRTRGVMAEVTLDKAPTSLRRGLLASVLLRPPAGEQSARRL